MKFSPSCIPSLFATVIAFSAHPVKADTNYDATADDLPSAETLNGIDSRIEGIVKTYNIPISNWPDELRLVGVRGGDGGRARAENSNGKTRTANGGGGAWGIANFQIDPSAPNALRPGGQLRFIVGNKGEDKTRANTAGSGGGGGSAVLYLDPTKETWEMLIVAGAGGGGAVSMVSGDRFDQNGRDASITEDG